MKTILVIVLLLSVAALTLGQDRAVWNTTVVIHNGFLSGNDFLKRSVVEQRFYAMGLVDGLLLAPFTGSPKENMNQLETLLEGMTGEQIVAIIRSYLQKNPERWNDSVHTSAYFSLKEAYEKKFGKTEKATQP